MATPTNTKLTPPTDQRHKKSGGRMRRCPRGPVLRHDRAAPRVFSFGRLKVHNLAARAVQRCFEMVYLARHTEEHRRLWPELYADDEQWRRSDHLETVCLVFGFLLHRCDFLTMRVILADGVDRGIGVIEIAEGIQKPQRVVERALQTLRNIGLIAGTEMRDTWITGADGAPRCVSSNAVRVLSDRLWLKLGHDLHADWIQVRNKAARKRRLPPPGRVRDLRVPRFAQYAPGLAGEARGPITTEQAPARAPPSSASEAERLARVREMFRARGENVDD